LDATALKQLSFVTPHHTMDKTNAELHKFYPY